MEVKTDSEKSGCLPRRTQGGTEIEGGVRMPWEAGDIYLHTKQTKPERTSPPQGCPESLLSGSSTIRQHGTERAEVESALCSKGNPTVAPPTFPFPDRTAQKPSVLPPSPRSLCHTHLRGGAAGTALGSPSSLYPHPLLSVPHSPLRRRPTVWEKP